MTETASIQGIPTEVTYAAIGEPSEVDATEMPYTYARIDPIKVRWHFNDHTVIAFPYYLYPYCIDRFTYVLTYLDTYMCMYLYINMYTAVCIHMCMYKGSEHALDQ